MAGDHGFAIGDQVRLLSGGPDMTVSSIFPMDNSISCQWFGGKRLETGTFSPKTLEKIAKKKEGDK